MPLTGEDVSNKRFTTVRLREGYDMTEVDQFLDEVEAELRRVGAESSEMRAKAGAVSVGAGAPAPPPPAPERKPEREPEPEKAAAPAPAEAKVPEQLKV